MLLVIILMSTLNYPCDWEPLRLNGNDAIVRGTLGLVRCPLCPKARETLFLSFLFYAPTRHRPRVPRSLVISAKETRDGTGAELTHQSEPKHKIPGMARPGPGQVLFYQRCYYKVSDEVNVVCHYVINHSENVEAFKLIALIPKGRSCSPEAVVRICSNQIHISYKIIFVLNLKT